MATQLPQLPNIRRLSSRGQYYLIGQDRERLLIDKEEGRPIWSESLKSALATENSTIKTVPLTHWHPDPNLGSARSTEHLS
ncbi:hypothetical protein PAAG_08723 [Paracoccidioides lutzii Pb01]|uniref:Metallo-beta-lactamase domain-containing protein n=1 Tax=Paracoccidioides lutzii (strain ATCC MYA-826 / Pb01) TaxID=502779 RepID=C1HD82_PARBA|nr:hypothetical protein PAAG_08723 [Paracoccidioides lutzii Pb01]EEH39454.2 hypothetical protein PAAG_08723 [Paracoccidioides lutzii Pb01]